MGGKTNEKTGYPIPEKKTCDETGHMGEKGGEEEMRI